MEPFPAKERKAQRSYSRVQYEGFCSCRLMRGDDKMARCDGCHEWYHNYSIFYFQEDERMVLSYLLRFVTASHCNQAKDMTFLCVFVIVYQYLYVSNFVVSFIINPAYKLPKFKFIWNLSFVSVGPK